MVKLYVEGGGDAAVLRTACREGFTKFITRAGLSKRPRIVACGSRTDAYNSFCTAIANNEAAALLVDSEDPISPQKYPNDPTKWQPWQHLKNRTGDGWDKPALSQDTDCHFMVQCMESWFVADRATLKKFFGQGFKEAQLPASSTILESLNKVAIYSALANSTKSCKTKAPYGKGEHSFGLLACIDPVTVSAASPWAKRFIDELKKKMDSS